ncbi:zinc-binding dehydrogenase [Anaerotalea alkaliphila]|uniref:Zinc-binding dehydrogenase n=1 Tax=Anaerotalea alkaliphila TaxID=2662126 RepID=A0A7X5KMR8_9FIRM|nr:zinc-binding dehydrogenase [Anaerotalea alkaliphila]NDL66993.1 zinc-binding dehydrogenase [Anaerotalea alkaliphila]
MITEAVRLYGVNDLRLEKFELPSIKEDEILARVVSDSICMSTYKAVIQGSKHKRVPEDIATNPTIMGHEFSGVIVEVGAKWSHQFQPGQKFAIQPALNYKGSPYAPGYSFPYFGGDATYTIIPNEVMELGFLLDYQGESFYEASLSEPMSCIIGGFHSNYHTETGKYVHHMGIVEGGKMALLAGAGPMGLGAIDYALHCDRKPGLLVVTDVDDNRLERARKLFLEEEALKEGVRLVFVNPATAPEGHLLDLTEGTGYDDIFVYAPVRALVESADSLLGKDGCLNFFAGPTDTAFKAEVNFYNVHYTPTHIMGSTGGNDDDMRESLEMSSKGLINPAVMITHVGGLDSCIDTTLRLPQIPGGKKLIYNSVRMPLTDLAELQGTKQEDPKLEALAEILRNNRGLWCAQAEKHLLENF